MKFRLPLFCVFPAFYFGNALSKIVPSNNSKFFLKYKDKFCLYPENVIETNKFEIASDECDKVAHEDEGKIVWLSFDDDRIRTHNGLCLNTFKNFLVVSSCSPNPDEASEKWRIDEEQHLKNEMNQCAQMAGNKLFSFSCNKLSTKEFELKPFTEAEINLMKVRYAQKKLENINQERILDLQKKSSAVISSYNDLEKEIEHMILNETEIEKEKNNIINIMNDVKLLLNNSSALKQYGTGALMIVYDSIHIKNKKSLFKIPVNKLEINENMLAELGLEQGEIKIVISSFLNVPEENEYNFVAKNIKGNIIIKLGNHEIISNENSPIDTEISSALIHLPKNILIPLHIEIYSTSGKPSFALYWSSNNFPEQIITAMYLYTTIFEKVCYPQTQKKIECSTTFETVQKSFFSEKNQELHFLCPSECLQLDKYPIYKKKNVIFLWEDHCYDLKSSICGAAVESNFLSNNFGGSINIVIKEIQNQDGQIEKCGFVIPNDLNDNTLQGITDIKLIDTDDFFTKFQINEDIYKGYKGIVTDDTHALLSKVDPSKKYIMDIDLHCEQGPITKKKTQEDVEDDNTDDELTGGSFIVRRGKSADLIQKNESIIVDVFALFDKYKEKKIDINIPGWSRKSCNNIQLFLKYKKKKDLLTYPSLLLSCNDTFENLSFEYNSTIIARCLPFCETDKPVIGSFIYSPHSPICKSAVHSGVITYFGGIIEITKIENITQRFQNTTNNTIVRNNVTAIINSDEQNTESYYISKPSGMLCNYPRNSFNINESLNADESWDNVEELEEQNDANQDLHFSFLQMETPPASLVTMKHAMLQDQLHKLHHVYSKDEYRQRYFPEIVSDKHEDKQEEVIEINHKLHHTKTPIGSDSCGESYCNNTDSDSRINVNSVSSNTEKDISIKSDFLKIKERFNQSKENLQNIALKSQGVFFSLLKKNSGFSSFSNKLSNIRIAQKHHDEFLKIYESSVSSLIKQFSLITQNKKRRIAELERALKEVQPIIIETFKETYKSTNINNNYIIIDALNNLNGPSNWQIEKYTKGNFVSSITNTSSIKSNEYLYGTYLINKHVKVCKGFISSDIKIPYMGDIGIIYKYTDYKNYNNFIINRKEYYFVEVQNGIVGDKINRTDLNIEIELGNWTKILLDFGYTNTRVYINDKYATGYKTKVDNCGLLGFGINGASEKVLFDKIVIGSLDQEKYYKRGIYKEFAQKEDHEIKSETLQDSEKVIGDTTKRRKIQQEIGKLEELNILEEGEERRTQETDICKPFKETFLYPLNTNWITHAESKWKVSQNVHIPFISSKEESEDAYLFSQQTSEDGTITPSIILLKTPKICNELKSYLFETSVNVQNSSKAGVIFKIKSNDNFLSFIIDTSGPLGKIYLLKISEGNPYQLLAPTHIPIKQNTWYNLKIQYDGSYAHITLNDESVFNASLDDPDTQTSTSTSKDLNVLSNLGNLGLIVLSGYGKFKNILFTPNPKQIQ